MTQANSKVRSDAVADGRGSDGRIPDGSHGCGVRLIRTREAAGLTQADVAERLKMPVRVVQSLEAEDWSRLGAPVFVRGQLRSYSRLLGLTTAPIVAASGVAPVEPPVLVPRTCTPPMQRMLEQASRRFVYIVLTAAIAVPVWLATRPHLGVVAHDAAPLDAPPDVGASAPGGTSGDTASGADPSPMVASMTPLSSQPVAGSAFLLRLKADSWVQVTAPDGHALEQSLLHAGEQRRYGVGEVGSIVLGNTAAVSVLRGGKLLDLAPYSRSNVARFTVSSDGSLAPVAD